MNTQVGDPIHSTSINKSNEIPRSTTDETQLQSVTNQQRQTIERKDN